MKNLGTRTALALLSTFTLSLTACGGEDGRTGPRGETGGNGLTSTREEPAGANCAEGGLAISIGFDLNRDLELDQQEIEDTVYVCNGEPGEPGDVTDLLFETVALEPDDDRCENGGVEIRFGADTNDNGMLDDGEFETNVLCNGPAGADGDPAAAATIGTGSDALKRKLRA
jgi:hypothetical protein